MMGHSKWSELEHKGSPATLDAARKKLKRALQRYRYASAWRSAFTRPVCRLVGHRESWPWYVNGHADEFGRSPEFYGKCVGCSRCGRILRRMAPDNFDPVDFWKARREPNV